MELYAYFVCMKRRVHTRELNKFFPPVYPLLGRRAKVAVHVTQVADTRAYVYQFLELLGIHRGRVLFRNEVGKWPTAHSACPAKGGRETHLFIILSRVVISRP